MTDSPLPAVGSKLRCVNNTDRPELKVGQVYTVVYFENIGKCPVNYARWQPIDFRHVAIAMPGEKECGIFPFGCFEPVQ